MDMLGHDDPRDKINRVQTQSLSHHIGKQIRNAGVTQERQTLVATKGDEADPAGDFPPRHFLADWMVMRHHRNTLGLQQDTLGLQSQA